MNKIQMVDLQSQYKAIQSEVESKMQEVLANCTFINGPAVKSFQTNLEEYLGVKHVIPCANGTDALQVAMMALGLKPGDEVITASFTFVATAEVIALLGLTPVLVDVDPITFNIDIEAIKRAITPKTKAIVPVHLFGQCADMDAIMEIAKEHDLFVIEDACQAIGSEHHSKNGKIAKAGTIGNVGCTSFFPSKNLGCYGDGGAIFTNDDALAHKMRIIVNHGMEVRYYHDSIGVNSRLDSLQAVVLDIKLKRLDQYNAARAKAAAYYTQAFSQCEKLQTPDTAPYNNHVFHQYTLVCKNLDRNALQAHLQSKDIPAMIYYPVPLHMQKAYIDPRYKEGDFPITENLCANVISLPMHTELSDEQLAYITNSVLEFVRK